MLRYLHQNQPTQELVVSDTNQKVTGYSPISPEVQWTEPTPRAMEQSRCVWLMVVLRPGANWTVPEEMRL